jgi:allantoinase
MREAARLDRPVAVHAESEELTRGLRASVAGGPIEHFLASRPVIAELDAIGRALLFAGETGARLHIVHVSTGRGVVLAAEARLGGVDVSIETCPHYLFFTEDDIERLGALAKCAPPLRAADEQQALWQSVADGFVDLVASDHSPSEPALKTGEFLGAWGGIAGVQSTLAVLLTRGFHDGRISLPRIASLLSSRPAERFRLARKGAIAPGCDADIVLVDLERPFTLRAEDLLQRHPQTPYVGSSFRGVVRRTIRRGETLFLDGDVLGASPGRFVRPL